MSPQTADSTIPRRQRLFLAENVCAPVPVVAAAVRWLDPLPGGGTCHGGTTAHACEAGMDADGPTIAICHQQDHPQGPSDPHERDLQKRPQYHLSHYPSTCFQRTQAV
ncbi:hypothetical protein TNCV_3604001 [Trichonephila clavipes]|nr:hypothetical protein TNCV_3604001 [Trichonephila clavipes]